ncbi:MAG: transposase [Opitutales bacterium]|nr:transposase [Opitutales bacterium]
MGDFFDVHESIERHGRDLPHWQQGEVLQFVTFRLGDSLPREKLTQWQSERKAWLEGRSQTWSAEEESEYHRLFTWRVEKWLDAGFGSCLLKEKRHRNVLEKTLMKFQGLRVEHYAWVIMPNHVHSLFKPLEEMHSLIKAWKGVSARLIGRGSIWQKMYRDTMIRDNQHFANVVRYIRRNPADLPVGSYTLWESPRAKGIR